MPHELNGVCLRYTVIVIDCTAVQCRFTLEEDYGIGRDSAVTLSSKAVGTILLHYSLIQAALVAAHASAAARYSSENLFFFFFGLQDSCLFLSSKRAFRTPDEPEIRRNNGLVCMQ